MNKVILSPGYFPDPNSNRSLSNADIYIGVVDLDPEIPANQKTVSVLQESGVIVPVSQPIKTGLGGTPVYNGSPVTLLVDGQHSLKVVNSFGSQVYYTPTNYVEQSIITADRIVPVAKNIAGLRTYSPTPTDGTINPILGHTIDGDGGGGNFVWDSDSVLIDNNGTIIQITGVTTGRWIRQYSGPVNVRWFGAKGNGINTENDSPAIQAAMAVSKDIFIPSGVYVLWTPLQHNTSDPISYFESQPPYVAVNKANGIKITGEGANNTVLVQKQSGFTGTELLYLNGNSDESATIETPLAQFYNSISGIHFKGVSKNLSALTGIRIRANMNCTYEDVIISDLHTGIYIEGNSGIGLTDVDTTAFIKFKNVVVHDCVQGYYGRNSRQSNVEFDTCSFIRMKTNGVNISVAGLVMTNCNISNNGTDSAISGGVVIGSSITASQNRGAVIQGCVFENNNRFHVKIGNLAGGVFSGNAHHPYANYGAAKLSILFIEKSADASIIDGIDIRGERVQTYGGAYYLTTPLIYIDIAGVVTNLTESSSSLSTVGTVATPYAIVTADPKELIFNTFDYTTGSNENGSWIKYPDGTAECYVLKEDQSATWTAIGTMFRSSGQSITLPITLADTTYSENIKIYDAGVNYAISASGMRSGKLVGSLGYFLFSPTDIGAGTFDVDVSVRGRWK